jgi:ATP-dependent RNA helicase DDX54/DBP10
MENDNTSNNNSIHSDNELPQPSQPHSQPHQQNPKKAKGFRTFHFPEQIYQGIKNMGYKNPTPIQRKVIPEILSGFNIIAHSRTGSGKTAAFLLPALSQLHTHSKIVGARCLILSPTRELAHQTAMFCRKLGKYTDLRFALLVGGNELESQFEKLAQNPDIIIATPGRVLHHIDEGSLQLKNIKHLIIDEGDKMMELNFGEQLRDIIKHCPLNKQIIILSATIQGELALFLKSGIIKEYKLINIEEENKIPDTLKINLIYTRKDIKIYTFISLFNENIINLNKELTIVFVMTKYHCEYIQEYLNYFNIQSMIIYGQMEQELRNKNLENFRKGKIKLLIVTDVAARGIDIPLLDNVINYDFPDSQKLFIHRVGRTARAGRKGTVFNLVTVDELPYFFDIKHALGKKFILSTDTTANTAEDTVDNYNTISFGTVPDKLINDIKNKKKDYLFNSQLDIEQLYQSMLKAEKKGISFQQKPTQYGIKQAKVLLNEFDMKLHPFYVEKYADEEKQNFLSMLKKFKPKENYFERVRETSVNEDIINEFKLKAERYRKKKALEKEREILSKQKELEMIEHEHYEADDNDDDNNNNDNEISIDENNNNNNTQQRSSKAAHPRKLKRSQIKNFKNPNHFISTEIDSADKKKSLWGNEKPIELDELTLNINTDDTMQTQRKTVWNEKKKKFVTANVDKSGKIRNESGKVVKKNEKYHPYKDWKSKSKLAIQNVGEIEKEYTVQSAKERFIERKRNKSVKNEVKNIAQILKEKKRKFKDMQKKNKKFSKKQFVQNQLKQRVNLNSRTQTFIKKRINVKRRKK